MSYSGYFSGNGVPFDHGARYSMSQIGPAQSRCVGVLRRRMATDWRPGKAGLVKDCRPLDGDGGSGGLFQNIFKED